MNGDTSSSLTTADLLHDGDQLQPGVGGPYASSCGGAVDPNYSIGYSGAR